MKKNVLVFGCIAGLIAAVWMWLTIGINGDGSMLSGYGSMLVAFSFIFVGIKNYRDKYNNGAISFGQGFKIGLLIALIGSTMYVISWLVLYYCYRPDFMDKYIEHALADAQKEGLSAAEMAKEKATLEGYREMYKSPLMVILFTYFEILPVGLAISIIAALILKRKPGDNAVAVA